MFQRKSIISILAVGLLSLAPTGFADAQEQQTSTVGLPPQLEELRGKSDQELAAIMEASTRKGPYGTEVVDYDRYWAARNLLEERGWKISATGLVEQRRQDAGQNAVPTVPSGQTEHDRQMTAIMLQNAEAKRRWLESLPEDAWAGGTPKPGYAGRTTAREQRDAIIEGYSMNGPMVPRTEPFTPEEQRAYEQAYQQSIQDEIATLESDIRRLEATGYAWAKARAAAKRRLIEILRTQSWGAYWKARALEDQAGRNLLLGTIIDMGGGLGIAGAGIRPPSTPVRPANGGSGSGGSGGRPTTGSGGRPSSSGDTTVIVSPVPGYQRLPGLFVRLNQIVMRLSEQISAEARAALMAEQRALIQQIDQIQGGGS